MAHTEWGGGGGWRACSEEGSGAHAWDRKKGCCDGVNSVKVSSTAAVELLGQDVKTTVL